jgi:hypothetical protein
LRQNSSNEGSAEEYNSGKTYRAVEVQLYAFLSSLEGEECSVLSPGRFSHGEGFPVYNRKEIKRGPIASLNVEQNNTALDGN